MGWSYKRGEKTTVLQEKKAAEQDDIKSVSSSVSFLLRILSLDTVVYINHATAIENPSVRRCCCKRPLSGESSVLSSTGSIPSILAQTPITYKKRNKDGFSSKPQNFLWYIDANKVTDWRHGHVIHLRVVWYNKMKCQVYTTGLQ